MKRQLSPPPIRRGGGKFEGSDSPQPSVSNLDRKIKKLRKVNEELRICDAEYRVEIADLRQEFDVLSRGLCAKVKRAFNEMGKENKYYANLDASSSHYLIKIRA